MAIFLCHATALALYDSGLIRVDKTTTFTALPDDHVPNITQSSLRQCVEQFHLTLPLCIAVPSPSHRRPSKSLYCLVLDRRYPRNRFLRITDEIYVAAPEVALLQVSRNMQELELIVTISQLCSRFSVTKTPKASFHERPAAFDKDYLLESANKIHETYGIRRLIEATEKAACGARSPAEVMFPLRMSLPRRLFGFGILAPEINQTVELPADGSSALAQREVDFLWRDARFIAEYDSRENHGEPTRDRDTIRANELIDAGYTVISVTAAQANNIQLTNRIAANIATHLYLNRSRANQLLLRQFLLKPDRDTLSGRISLNIELRQIFKGSPWDRVLLEKQSANERIRAQGLSRQKRARNEQEPPLLP